MGALLQGCGEVGEHKKVSWGDDGGGDTEKACLDSEQEGFLAEDEVVMAGID